MIRAAQILDSVQGIGRSEAIAGRRGSRGQVGIHPGRTGHVGGRVIGTATGKGISPFTTDKHVVVVITYQCIIIV